MIQAIAIVMLVLVAATGIQTCRLKDAQGDVTTAVAARDAAQADYRRETENREACDHALSIQSTRVRELAADAAALQSSGTAASRRVLSAPGPPQPASDSPDEMNQWLEALLSP